MCFAYRLPGTGRQKTNLQEELFGPELHFLVLRMGYGLGAGTYAGFGFGLTTV